MYSDSNKTIRVRQTNDKGYITIKGSVIGLSRPEFEYEIPKAEAEELLNKFSVSELIKVRYKILFKNKVWEIDEFLGDNLGLIVAEIEIPSMDYDVQIPKFISDKLLMEVTGMKQFGNRNLSNKHVRKN